MGEEIRPDRTVELVTLLESLFSFRREDLRQALRNRPELMNSFLDWMFREVPFLEEESVLDNLVTEEEIIAMVAADMGLEYARREDLSPGPKVLAFIPPEIARRLCVLPIRASLDEVWIAMNDPNDAAKREQLERFLKPRKLNLAIATEEHLNEAIKRCYGEVEQSE